MVSPLHPLYPPRVFSLSLFSSLFSHPLLFVYWVSFLQTFSLPLGLSLSSFPLFCSSLIFLKSPPLWSDKRENPVSVTTICLGWKDIGRRGSNNASFTIDMAGLWGHHQSYQRLFAHDWRETWDCLHFPLSILILFTHEHGTLKPCLLSAKFNK